VAPAREGNSNIYTSTEITAVVVNYRTPLLTQLCVESLRRHTSVAPLVIVDNGSDEETVRQLEDLVRPRTTLIRNPVNLGHGPALDQAIRASETDFVLTLDSDVEIVRDGIIELLLEGMTDPKTLAAGHQIEMNRYGYHASPNARLVIPYIHPAAMMLRRSLYLELPPFQHHGSPCLSTMRAAMDSGFLVANVALENHVLHLGEGTCSRFGYGLGIRTSFNKLLNDLGLFE